MSKRKIGDWVEIQDSAKSFYKKGDIGVLIRKDSNGDWWADFSKIKGQDYYMDGIWCIGCENREIRND